MDASEKSVAGFPPDVRDIRKAILDIVSESKRRLTRRDLEKTFSCRSAANKQAVGSAINGLVADGELAYTYQFGCSFLENSFNRPVRISRRIVLKPSGMAYAPEPDDVVITIRHGAAFGSGDHPTTRLSVRGIEAALSDPAFHGRNRSVGALDIGTGSGVLALVAVALGADTALGIDIDPCAIAEARENVKINRLGGRIEIHARDVENIGDTFALITANLRYPTLKKLCGVIAGLAETRGAVVLSGIKTDEADDLIDIYTEKRFRCTWKDTEKEWAGLVFAR